MQHVSALLKKNCTQSLVDYVIHEKIWHLSFIVTTTSNLPRMLDLNSQKEKSQLSYRCNVTAVKRRRRDGATQLCRVDVEFDSS